MSECQCGHDADEHQDGTGRCAGWCGVDPHMGEYACVCPYVTEEKL